MQLCGIVNRENGTFPPCDVFQQRDMPGMVLRRIETVIPTMDELKPLACAEKLADQTRHYYPFVGATGTGKSTSLASLIGYRNQNSKGHIITIEDPIEFVHQHAGCIVTSVKSGLIQIHLKSH